MEKLIVDKYAPTSIDDIILCDDQREMFKNYIKTGSCPNLLLYGIQGCGKSSLAKVLSKSYNSDVLYINASVDRSVDVIQDKLLGFINSVTLKDFKIVILDDSDALTKTSGKGGSAQDSLKNIIESGYDDTRIFITCNNINSIIEPIRSRCTPLTPLYSQTDVVKRILHILQSEKVTYTPEIFKEFNKLVITKYFPDFRLILGIFEQCIVSSELKIIDSISKDKEYSELTVNIMEMIDNKVSITNVREYYLQHTSTFNNDYESLAGTIFDYCIKLNTYSPKILLKLSTSIYKMHNVIDQEIQFCGMLLELY